jgi:hypothetical protein
MVDGAKFWISCKRLKALRKASQWQMIKCSAPSIICWRQCDISEYWFERICLCFEPRKLKLPYKKILNGLFFNVLVCSIVQITLPCSLHWKQLYFRPWQVLSSSSLYYIFWFVLTMWDGSEEMWTLDIFSRPFYNTRFFLLGIFTL